MVLVTVPEGTFLTSSVSINSGVYLATPTSILINNSGNPLLLTSDSGGAILWSGVITSVSVTAPAANSGIIYVGGYVAGQMPYSGNGLPLSPGAIVTISVANLGYVRVFGTTSGYDRVGYLGMG